MNECANPLTNSLSAERLFSTQQTRPHDANPVYVTDEYYLYRGVSFIDALNEADPDMILCLVRALEQRHFEFVGSTLLCLMDDYDGICQEDALEQIVGSFR